MCRPSLQDEKSCQGENTRLFTAASETKEKKFCKHQVHVEKRLKEENERLVHYLDQSSKWQLIYTVEKQVFVFKLLLMVYFIDIERKFRLLEVCYVRATSTAFVAFFLFFCCSH
jgi:hypothetical protein